jgi:putative hydrolase of the HAD superfamily
LPAGALATAAFEPTLLRAATTGEITDEEWRSRIATRLTAEHGERALAAVDAWSALDGTVVVDDRPSHLEEARIGGAAVVCHERADRTRAALVALGLPLRP